MLKRKTGRKKDMSDRYEASGIPYPTPRQKHQKK